MAATKKPSNETVLKIPLSEITADFAWNGRSGKWTEADGAEDKHDFALLVLDIKTNGQDTPVHVRPKKSGKGYILVAGFRRFAAISKIAEEAGGKSSVKDATIDAIVKSYSDIEARTFNIRENTAREDLKAADLVWSVADLLAAYKAGGKTPPTDEAFAALISKSQPYTSKLLRIAKNVPEKLLAKWRAAEVIVTVDNMDGIARLSDAAAMEAKFKELVSSKEGATGNAGKNRWIDTAKKKAIEIGTLIGNLERLEKIDSHGLNFEDDDDMAACMTIKKEATAAQRRAIGKEANKAYHAAIKAPSSEDDSASE